MINISPIGRNATIQERLDFQAYDKIHNVRKKFVEVLKEKFADYGLTYSIGGQISFDVVRVDCHLRCLEHFRLLFAFPCPHPPPSVPCGMGQDVLAPNDRPRRLHHHSLLRRPHLRRSPPSLSLA